MIDGNKASRRVLHTSDLHLTSLGDEACHCLEALVDLAKKTKVDLFIVAGDLFDYNRVDDDLISFVTRQWQRLSAETVILAGNHDCLVPGSAMERANFWKDCANVRVFRSPEGETLDLAELGISLWGKSLNSHDGGFRPLAGVPRPQRNGWWHIAVAHGYYVGADTHSLRSFQISQQEVATSGQDYIALGHYPIFRCVFSEAVKAYYCDSPSVTGTAVVVELAEETGVQVTSIPFVNKGRKISGII